MQSTPNIVYLFFIFVILETCIVHGDPEPMVRPTRPKVFTSPQELRRYLDLVRDYYSLNGKARYGKRGEVSDGPNRHWDALRTILEVSQQIQQQPQFEKDRQENEQVLHNFQNAEDSKYVSRIGERPNVFDTIRKYYDYVQ